MDSSLDKNNKYQGVLSLPYSSMTYPFMTENRIITLRSSVVIAGQWLGILLTNLILLFYP